MTEAELVEAVAKGMFEVHNNTITWGQVAEYMRRIYRRYAKTAIRLVREQETK